MSLSIRKMKKRLYRKHSSKVCEKWCWRRWSESLQRYVRIIIRIPTRMVLNKGKR